MSSQLTALIVEDSATQAYQLQRILAEAQIAGTIATGGEKALALLAEKSFDIVLTDIVMPGMSGYDLCKRIKQMNSGIPVVLLTALNNPSDIVLGLECGAANFIAKPYDKQHLLSRIKHIIRNQQLRQTGAITGGVPIQIQGEDKAIDVSSEQVMDFLLSTFEDYARANQRELEAKQHEKERALEAENYKVHQELIHQELEAQKEREIAGLLAQQAEQLRRSEERYNLAIEGSHDGIWDWDLVNDTVFYSDKCKLQVGYQPDEIDEKDRNFMQALIHPEDRDRVFTAINEHLVKHIPYDIEYRVRTKSGEYKWLHSRGQAVWNAAGRAVRLAGSHRDISDRIIAQEKLTATNQALAEREARMRVMIDTAPDGIFTVGGDGVIESASAKMHRMFGYKPGELPGKQIFDLVPTFFEAAFLKDQFSTWQGKVFEGGRELDGHRKDGSFVPIELALSVLSLGSKQIITGIARDISDRRRTDERLRIQYSITKVLAESRDIKQAAVKVLEILGENDNWSALGLWLLKDGAMLLSSAQVEHNNSHAHSLDDLVAYLKTNKIQHGQGLLGSTWSKNAPQAARLGTAEQAEFGDFKEQIGGTKMHSAVAFPVRGNNGELLGLIEIFSAKTREIDPEMIITLESLGAQIGQFVERVSAEQRLQESEHLLMQLAENVPEVFWIASPTFQKLYYASPAYEKIWGRSLKDLYENPTSFLTFIVKEDQARVQQHVIHVRKHHAGEEIEYDILRPDGTVRNIAARTTATFDENGRSTRLLGIARDVSEKKEAERRVSEFYSTVSHELRTPLTSIRGSLGLIEGGLTGPLSDKTLQFIKIARAESDRLIRLINEILDIRKIEAGKLELKLRAVSAKELAASVAEGIKGMASTAGVFVDNSVQSDVKLHCDKDRIIQVLNNLVSNAIKFSEHGQTVTIKFEDAEDSDDSEDADENYYRFSVKDQGPGIAQGELSKLFNLFQQLDSSDTRDKGGTGLGLAISKAIVELHKGSIGVDSKLGDGSTFWFELPEADPDDHQETTGTRRRVADMSTSGRVVSGAKSRVLVVEDDLSTRELIIHQLKSVGMDCLVASDGEAAIEIAQTKKPDLIVLDVGVPKTDGFEVIRVLRKGSARATPLIIYTSRDLEEADREQLTLGPTRHLIKSRTAEDGLLEAVKELLHKD